MEVGAGFVQITYTETFILVAAFLRSPPNACSKELLSFDGRCVCVTGIDAGFNYAVGS